MYERLYDTGLFRKFDGIRIAWPFFMPALQQRRSAAGRAGKAVSCLTRSEILDLFADEFYRHPVPVRTSGESGRGGAHASLTVSARQISA